MRFGIVGGLIGRRASSRAWRSRAATSSSCTPAWWRASASAAGLRALVVAARSGHRGDRREQPQRRPHGARGRRGWRTGPCDCCAA